MVRCPVRLVEAGQAAWAGADDQRVVHVWTRHRSAVDAYDEALRVLQGWPQGARPVDVLPLGMYVRVAGTG